MACDVNSYETDNHIQQWNGVSYLPDRKLFSIETIFM